MKPSAKPRGGAGSALDDEAEPTAAAPNHPNREALFGDLGAKLEILGNGEAVAGLDQKSFRAAIADGAVGDAVAVIEDRLGGLEGAAPLRPVDMAAAQPPPTTDWIRVRART